MIPEAFLLLTIWAAACGLQWPRCSWRGTGYEQFSRRVTWDGSRVGAADELNHEKHRAGDVTLYSSHALALPPMDKTRKYIVLKEYLEKRHPLQHVVFVHEDEKLLNKGAENTGLIVRMTKDRKSKGLRVWMVRGSA